MPCYDPPPTEEWTAHNSPQVEMLCTMCECAVKNGLTIPKSVVAWWEKHKERDSENKD